MKKLAIVFISALLLVACNSSTLSISELEVVPKQVQSKIENQHSLQLITDGETASYIVFQSSGTVTTDLETKDNTLIVKLDETNKTQAVKTHVYKLTLDPEHEAIEVFVNGTAQPFDLVTGI